MTKYIKFRAEDAPYGVPMYRTFGGLGKEVVIRDGLRRRVTEEYAKGKKVSISGDTFWEGREVLNNRASAIYLMPVVDSVPEI